MPLTHWHPREHWLLGRFVLRWLGLAVPMAIVTGSACALFLWSLEKVTDTRHAHPWLLYLLPLAGVLIALVYQAFGKNTESGHNLLIEQIHRPGGGVPKRMAPLILISTVVTHLFGGSAGREGTAVQMGGSIAGVFCRLFRLSEQSVRIMLMAGIAAGFGAVFGTPLTGAVFAMEVLAIGAIGYEAIIPCLIASIVADWSCTRWGIHHTDYAALIGAIPIPRLDGIILLKVAIASIAFGLASVIFAQLTHGVQRTFKRLIPFGWLRPFIGGLLVIGLALLIGRDYLGLSVNPVPGEVSIVSAFSLNGAHAWSWWWKILFTAITLGCGFKGGEVTPLFFVGAALGNTLGHLLGIPPEVFPLFPALGFVAVFAGATNTPLACTIMGVELFGGQHVIYFATACFLAYLFSGHSSIYPAQRIATQKGPAA